MQMTENVVLVSAVYLYHLNPSEGLVCTHPTLGEKQTAQQVKDTECMQIWRKCLNKSRSCHKLWKYLVKCGAVCAALFNFFNGK